MKQLPQLQQILDAIGNLAPWDLAESWDRVGLQIGNNHQPVCKVMVALDINQQIIQEGLVNQVDGFIVHHPLIFKPLTRIDSLTPVGECICALIKQDLFLIAAHTNVDKAEKGLNQYLAEQFGLLQIEPLEPVAAQNYKVVVFTPEEFLKKIKTVMSEAGAGIIGEYSTCSFEQKGVGSFQPNSEARPFIGKPGELMAVPEIRLEMSAEAGSLAEILKTIKLNHPYEQPVIDVYPLLSSSRHGLGRIGNLKTALTLQDLCSAVRKKLSAKSIKVVGAPNKPIKRLAICSGSGGSLMATAIQKQADAYITGDLDYHDFLTAKDNDLMVIDAGHWTTEHCFISLLSNYLHDFFSSENNLEVVASNTIIAEPYLTLMS